MLCMTTEKHKAIFQDHTQTPHTFGINKSNYSNPSQHDITECAFTPYTVCTTLMYKTVSHSGWRLFFCLIYDVQPSDNTLGCKRHFINCKSYCIHSHIMIQVHTHSVVQHQMIHQDH